MNQNYVRYQVTREGKRVSEADWFFVETTVALERSDIFVGFASVSIASMGTAYLQLNTGSSDLYLLDYGITTNSARVTEKILESPSLTTGTTPVTMVCTNRKEPRTPGFLVYSNPTNVTGGITVDQVESFEEKKSDSSVATADQKRIKFKPNTTYVLSIYNGDNSINTFFIKWYFMEVL